jgi:hypothetical protein
VFSKKERSSLERGWGAICRDSASDIQFTAAGQIETISNARHAEALALSNACQIAKQTGVRDVLFLKQTATTFSVR